MKYWIVLDNGDFVNILSRHKRLSIAKKRLAKFRKFFGKDTKLVLVKI